MGRFATKAENPHTVEQIRLCHTVNHDGCRACSDYQRKKWLA